jgi:ATP-dependent helicase HrpA
MHLRDLLKKPADEITLEKYPDTIHVGEMTLPMIYRYEPGHPADGITVSVPLAGLNQLRTEAFEWLIPGWLEEKILALIRSLPKSLRTNFIPAPEYAASAMNTLKPGDGPLHEAMAVYLGKVSGVDVRPGSFDPASLPAHLLMRFEVLDEAGKVIAAGRDLAEIRRELGVRAQANLGKLIDSPWNRDNVTAWDFGDLPERVEIQQHGMTLHAYPALVDQGNTVGLRLFESPEAAAVAHRAGVRRLFILQLGPDVKNLARHVRNLEEASVMYTTVQHSPPAEAGSPAELRDDVLTAAADRALFSEGGEIRTREAFVDRAQSGWKKLLLAANEITQIALDMLRELAEVTKLMELGYAPAWRDAFVDIRRQLQLALPRGFVIKTPSHWLPHLPRFVRAIRVRLEKLRDSGLNRDLAGLVQIGPMFQQYLERQSEHERAGVVDPELEKYRWMLEELRVSLFAQELKTSIPISVQRLDRQWALVRQ